MLNTKIFSRELPATASNEDGFSTSQRHAAIIALQNEINDFRNENPQSSVEWLQSSGPTRSGGFTQLTAIVSYNK